MDIAQINVSLPPIANKVHVSHLSSVMESARDRLWKALLEARPELKREDILLAHWESVTWNNGALGCPEEGKFYTQALVPGFRISFRVGDEFYAIHTDLAGRMFVSPDLRLRS